MSTTTAQFEARHYPNGPLLDPDGNTMTFGDVTATLAVTRFDNSVPVSPPTIGTALTRASQGIYQYTITDPALDLIYLFYITYLNGGVRKYAVFNIVGTRTTPTPPLASQVIGTGVTRDPFGNAVGCAQINVQMTAGPGNPGESFDGRPTQVTSDVNGNLSITMQRGASYNLWRGNSDANAVTISPVPNADFLLPELIGVDI